MLSPLQCRTAGYDISLLTRAALRCSVWTRMCRSRREYLVGFPATVKHSVLTHQRVFVTTPVKSIGNDLSTGAGAGFGWLLLMINVTAMVWFAVTFSNV